ncbi:type VII secretion target [Kitasatospora sp. NPDC093806]|uniref:WXG100 family type VII secretion target n=1 Tax=Kitasatospora sp. NPDC093806 TaxID=3155075 RepID=UPI003437C98C
MPNPDLASAVKVNPAALQGCGQTAQHIAGQVPGETTKIIAPSDQAAATLQGWSTAAAIHNCGANWKTLLDKLSGDMSDVGAKLVTTAGHYRQVEQSVYAHLRGAAGPAQGGATPALASDPFGTVLASESSPAAATARAAAERKAR